MKLEEHGGKCLLSSAPGRFFGQCGPASIFEFLRQEGDLFYGMGEKWTGLEHSGKTTKFWNTDVWADFNENAFIQSKPAPDPVYLSIRASSSTNPTMFTGAAAGRWLSA
ncbi:MAG: hypothetical protein WBL40_12530 [Terrimicrobiaceae bacterium]